MKNKNLLFILVFSLMLISLSCVNAVLVPAWFNSSGDNQNKDYLTTDLEAGFNFDQASGDITDVYIGVNNGTNYATLGEGGLINNSAHLYSAEYLFFPAFHTIETSISYSFWLNWDGGGDPIVERLWSSQSEFEDYIAESDGKITFIPKNSESFTTNSAIEVGNWTHIVYICDINNYNQSVYINGVLDISVVNTVGCPVMVEGNGLYFGRLYSAGVRYYKGFIDDAYFWNRTINNTEVLDLYNSGNDLTFGYEDIAIINAVLLLPINDTKTNQVLNYTANISCSAGCLNATLYFRNSTGVIHSVFTDLTGINNIELGNQVNLSAYGLNGIYTWDYELTDTLNNIATSEERTILIDTSSPFINWHDPTTTTLTSATTYSLNISVANLLLKDVNLSVYNSTGNIIYNNFTGDINLSNFQISDIIPLDEGENSVEVYAIDQVLISITDTKIINRDTISPTVVITYPISTNYSTKPNDLSGNITEINCDRIWYSLDNGVTNSSTTDCNGYSSFTFLGLSGYVNTGSNTWVVYVNDTIGHESSDSVTFDYTPIVIPPPAYTSTPIYQTINSFGAGLGIFLQFLGIGIGGLLILLILIAVISLIIYAIVGMIKSSLKYGYVIQNNHAL